jgi:hypothetical protein
MSIVEAKMSDQVSELEAYWGRESDEDWGIHYPDAEAGDDPDRDMGASHLPDGTYAATCTNWARMVKARYGDRAEIKYILSRLSPALHADGYDGHDFAVLDGRYLIDGWAKQFPGRPRAVLDLQDPADHEEIITYYGDPKLWRSFDQTYDDER